MYKLYFTFLGDWIRWKRNSSVPKLSFNWDGWNGLLPRKVSPMWPGRREKVVHRIVELNLESHFPRFRLARSKCMRTLQDAQDLLTVSSFLPDTNSLNNIMVDKDLWWLNRQTTPRIQLFKKLFVVYNNEFLSYLEMMSVDKAANDKNKTRVFWMMLENEMK